MNLQETIKNILREETDYKINSLIEKYIDKYYRLDINVEPVRPLETIRTRVFGIDIKLYPKLVEDIKKTQQPSVYYSTWVLGNGTVTCYDTNSAYVQPGIFKKMGLEKELLNYLYGLTKSYARKLAEQ